MADVVLEKELEHVMVEIKLAGLLQYQEKVFTLHFSGKDADIEPCGLEVCSNPDVDINHRCQGQIVMPCDLMGKLDFEASSGEIATFEEDDRVRVVKDDRENCIK